MLALHDFRLPVAHSVLWPRRPASESPRVVGGQERCATAKKDLKRTMENSPAGKVYGLAIVIMSHPYLVRQIGDSVDCAATVTLNNNQESAGLAPQPTDLLAGRAAMRANRPIRPEPRFDIRVSCFFAMKLCS
jgi:hypothetical protein